jgi:hypothetical protein
LGRGVLSLFPPRAMLGEEINDLTCLNSVMEDVCKVNEAMAERIRDGFDENAMVNAIVVLDCFAMTVPMAIESRFDGLKRLFKS